MHIRFYIVPLALSALLLSGAGCWRAADKAPDQAEQAATRLQADLAAAEKLDLSNSDLTKVPAYVFGQFRLTELNLSHNRLIGALPAEIRQLTKLQVLDVSGNLMTGVPAEIGQLSELRRLDLSNNRLTGLPQELGDLKNLEELDLSGNSVSENDLAIISSLLPKTVKIIR